MNNEPAVPETRGVTVKVLSTVDLGPEIEGLAPKQGNDSGGGDLGRYRQARLNDCFR
jgi:hypothetical protein